MNVTSSDTPKKARKGIRQHRGRRFLAAMNALVCVLMALAALVIVNRLAYKYYYRWDQSSRSYYDLSDRTRTLLAGIDAEIDIVAFFQKRHEHFDDVRNLLREYQYEAAKTDSLKLTIQFIDPDRDLARTKELALKYDVPEPNVIVFETGGRRKYVEAKDIADYDYSMQEKRAVKKKVGFRGEEVFSSAIQSVLQAATPVVYCLTGHGERDVSDKNEQMGYSGVARVMLRDNMAVRPLLLTRESGIPKDCSVLLVAGPSRKLSSTEIEILSAYLSNGGRACFLLDPAKTTGIEELLQDWGVKLESEIVVGMTITGRELIVSQYGKHPVTRHLKNVATMFYKPRSVESLASSDSAVSVLAFNTRQGWAEKDLGQSPPVFDQGIDRVGPIGVAVGVEKAPAGAPAQESKPARIIVIGDSYFVCNGALSGAVGGNIDFFMSAMNWLAAREQLMGIAPKVPGELHLDMNRRQMNIAFLVVVGGMPGCIALIGLIVWRRRKH